MSADNWASMPTSSWEPVAHTRWVKIEERLLHLADDGLSNASRVDEASVRAAMPRDAREGVPSPVLRLIQTQASAGLSDVRRAAINVDYALQRTARFATNLFTFKNKEGAAAPSPESE